MTDESGVAVGSGSKKKSGKRKASGAPRAQRTNLIEAEFGPKGVVAGKAYFSAHKDEKKELMSALRAKSKAADPEKVAKIQASIAKLTAKLNAANNSVEIIAKFQAKLQSVANLIYGEA